MFGMGDQVGPISGNWPQTRPAILRLPAHGTG